MSEDINISGMWCEQYRPKVLEDLILNNESYRIINAYKTEGVIPNLLFHGNPGCGKTTCAQILVKDILKCNFLYINASDESGIDTIRTKITNFAQTKSFDGNIKVVILDEGDYFSAHAQAALRNTMETYSKYCRFIITANYKHRIIPALQSRCQTIELKPVIEDVVKRCYNILKQEGVDVEDDQKKKFIQLVKRYFPDIRKIINELQKNIVDKKLVISTLVGDEELLEKCLDRVVNKDTLSLRKFLIENETRFNGDYDALLGDFLNYIYKSKLNDAKKKVVIAIIAEHLWKSVHVVDKEINAFACFLNIETALY